MVTAGVQASSFTWRTGSVRWIRPSDKIMLSAHNLRTRWSERGHDNRTHDAMLRKRGPASRERAALSMDTTMSRYSSRDTVWKAEAAPYRAPYQSGSGQGYRSHF